MGISKSIKGLFMKKKSKLDVESSSTDSGIKSPKTKPKRRVSVFKRVKKNRRFLIMEIYYLINLVVLNEIKYNLN